MAAADLDPTAAWCRHCGARGCPYPTPAAHVPSRRRWRLFGRGRRD
jgi:hypothetical protein